METLDYSSYTKGETPNELKYASDLLPVGINGKSMRRRFYAPAGTYGGIGSPNTSTVRIQLNSNGFLNLQDGVLVLKVNNNAAHSVYLDSSAHSFINRLQIYSPNMGSLELIENYNVLACALGDCQLSLNYRNTIGSSLAGYSTTGNNNVFTFGLSASNVFLFNSIRIDASGVAGFLESYDISPGLNVSRVAGDTAGVIRINAVTLNCTTGGAANVTWNGITFATTGVANSITIEGVAIATNAVAVERSFLTAQPTYSYNAQNEIIPANTSRTYRFPLISGIFNSSKYLPSQFLTNNGLTLDLQLAPTLDVFYNPNDTLGSISNYTVTEIYYECPVISFDEAFNIEFRNLIASNNCKFHGVCYQTNSTAYTQGANTYTISSKSRCPKSILAVFRPTPAGVRFPRISRRILPNTAFSYQFRIGSQLVPEVPVKVEVDGNNNVVDSSELYAELLKAFSLLSSIKHDCVISKYNMLGTGAGLIGADLEVYPQNSMKLEKSNFDLVSNNLPFDFQLLSGTFSAAGQVDFFLMSDVIFMVTNDGNILRST